MVSLFPHCPLPNIQYIYIYQSHSIQRNPIKYKTNFIILLIPALQKLHLLFQVKIQVIAVPYNSPGVSTVMLNLAALHSLPHSASPWWPACCFSNTVDNHPLPGKLFFKKAIHMSWSPNLQISTQTLPSYLRPSLTILFKVATVSLQHFLSLPLLYM